MKHLIGKLIRVYPNCSESRLFLYSENDSGRLLHQKFRSEGNERYKHILLVLEVFFYSNIIFYGVTKCSSLDEKQVYILKVLYNNEIYYFYECCGKIEIVNGNT